MASQVPVAPPPPGVYEKEPLETFFQRGWNKCKQQPLVPLGAVVTVWALLGAVRAFRRGNSQDMNRYLRFRVVAQGATVAAMLVGSVVYEKVIQEQKELESLKEKERMHSILDSLGDGPVTVVPSTATPAPTLPVKEVILPTPQPSVSTTSEHTLSDSDKPKQIRYTGSSDKWREHFNQRTQQNSTEAVSSGTDTTESAKPDPTPRSGGWFSWGGSK